MSLIWAFRKQKSDLTCCPSAALGLTWPDVGGWVGGGGGGGGMGGEGAGGRVEGPDLTSSACVTDTGLTWPFQWWGTNPIPFACVGVVGLTWPFWRWGGGGGQDDPLHLCCCRGPHLALQAVGDRPDPLRL